MALNADLCSVMHAEMRPSNGLGFNHSGSRILISNNLSLGNNAQCLSKYNNNLHKVNQISMSTAKRATKRISAAVKPLEVDGGATTLKVKKQAASPFTTKVVSITTLAGTKGEVGEICHIVLDHGGSFSFVEGQYLAAFLHPDDNDLSYTRTRVTSSFFSIASCRLGDSFDGKTLSLCVRRSSLSADSVSNFLCNTKAGDEVDITGPFGKAMVFPEDPKANHIMVATSTGVSPFRSNLQRMFMCPGSQVTFTGLAWLTPGDESVDELIYNDEFSQIFAQNPDHFKYHEGNIYQNIEEIFTFLEDRRAYIYFAGLSTMMPGILEAFEKVAEKRSVNWADMLADLIAKNQWRAEVY